MQRGLAMLGYVPVPGLGWLAAALSKGDRLARLHGSQSGVLNVAFVLLLLVIAVLDGKARDVVAALVGATWLTYTLTGVVAAARGRFVRLRGAWDVAAAGYVVRMRGS